MIFQIGSSLAAGSALAQSVLTLAISGWWVIFIFIILVVAISIFILTNRQEPEVPPAIEHGHEHAGFHHEGGQASEHVRLAESPQLDDLALIEGIGPKIATLFGENGIYTFRQLAESDLDELNRILDQAGLAFADPASWPEQARLADLQEWEALSELQANLKAGRKQ